MTKHPEVFTAEIIAFGAEARPALPIREYIQLPRVGTNRIDFMTFAHRECKAMISQLRSRRAMTSACLKEAVIGLTPGGEVLMYREKKRMGRVLRFFVSRRTIFCCLDDIGREPSFHSTMLKTYPHQTLQLMICSIQRTMVTWPSLILSFLRWYTTRMTRILLNAGKNNTMTLSQKIGY